jgi:RNA polymerase sigma factor (sigma-70 family)
MQGVRRQVCVMGERQELGLVAGEPMLIDPAHNAGHLDGAGSNHVDAVFREHSRRLVHLAAAITLDRWLAEEVVQDAFAGLQANATDVDDPVGYLQCSVVNRSVSVIRRRKVADRHPAPVARPTIDPDIDETWHLVAELPVRERAAIVCRYWLDLSERDIADHLGWPTGTVKSTLHRALRRLRRQLS